MKVKKSNNLQTIYVMWLREMKRFLRAKSRVIGTWQCHSFLLQWDLGLILVLLYQVLGQI